MAPGGGGMFGRVVLVATLGVAAALFGSFSLLGRLSGPATVVAASAPPAGAPAVAEAQPPAPAESPAPRLSRGAAAG